MSRHQQMLTAEPHGIDAAVLEQLGQLARELPGRTVAVACAPRGPHELSATALVIRLADGRDSTCPRGALPSRRQPSSR